MVNGHDILKHFSTEISDVASIVAQLQGQRMAHGGDLGFRVGEPKKPCAVAVARGSQVEAGLAVVEPRHMPGERLIGVCALSHDRPLGLLIVVVEPYGCPWKDGLEGLVDTQGNAGVFLVPLVYGAEGVHDHKVRLDRSGKCSELLLNRKRTDNVAG